MHGGHSAKPDRPAHHSKHCLSETTALLLVGQLRGADTTFPARLLPRNFQFLSVVWLVEMRTRVPASKDNRSI